MAQFAIVFIMEELIRKAYAEASLFASVDEPYLRASSVEYLIPLPSANMG